MADYSITEAASLLGVSRSTLRNLAEAGEIPCWRTDGGHRRFPETELRAYRAQSMGERPGAAERAAAWTAAALAVLRGAEADLGSESPLAHRIRAAAAELRRPPSGSRLSGWCRLMRLLAVIVI